MGLKEARHSAGINNLTAIDCLKQVEPRIDKPMLSKMENGICLPTPPVFSEMCKLYGKAPEEILRPEDVDFGILRVVKRKGDRHRLKRKVTFRLTPWAETVLQPDKIKACGYKDMTHWFYTCVKRFEKEYAKMQKREGIG